MKYFLSHMEMTTSVRKRLTSNFYIERCGDTERASISHPTPAGQDTLRQTPYSIRNTMVDYRLSSQHAPVQYALMQYHRRRQNQRLATNDNVNHPRNRPIPQENQYRTHYASPHLTHITHNRITPAIRATSTPPHIQSQLKTTRSVTDSGQSN